MIVFIVVQTFRSFRCNSRARERVACTDSGPLMGCFTQERLDRTSELPCVTHRIPTHKPSRLWIEITCFKPFHSFQADESTHASRHNCILTLRRSARKQHQLSFSGLSASETPDFTRSIRFIVRNNFKPIIESHHLVPNRPALSSKSPAKLRLQQIQYIPTAEHLNVLASCRARCGRVKRDARDRTQKE